MTQPRLSSRMQGFNMLEVLVSLVVVMTGLLGLAGLQARAQQMELESYQRAQALVLLYDMVDRINNSRETASCFRWTTDTTNGTPFLGDPTGGSHWTPVCSASNPQYNTLAVSSLTAWDNLLRGASESKAGVEVGAMIGARGCVSYNAATEFIDASTGANISGTGEYTVAVSWQGMSDSFTPTVACAKGATYYGSDSKRRTVWVTMRMATLAAR